jgi:hypothetical protein
MQPLLKEQLARGSSEHAASTAEKKVGDGAEAAEDGRQAGEALRRKAQRGRGHVALVVKTEHGTSEPAGLQ